MPCLNEADTLGALHRQGAAGAARSAASPARSSSPTTGARTARRRSPSALARGSSVVAARGYGNALMGGIAAPRGRYVIMGDADDSYDFLEIPEFVDEAARRLRPRAGLPLPPGGGRVMPGAMPFLHRWLGQSDVLGDGAALVRRADPRRVLRAARLHEGRTTRPLRPALHGHGVRDRDDHQVEPRATHGSPRCRSRCTRTAARPTRPHLRTFRDGWRTLRFFLMYSPRWLFLVPGAVLMLARAARLRARPARRAASGA